MVILKEVSSKDDDVDVCPEVTCNMCSGLAVPGAAAGLLLVLLRADDQGDGGAPGHHQHAHRAQEAEVLREVQRRHHEHGRLLHGGDHRQAP